MSIFSSLMRTEVNSWGRFPMKTLHRDEALKAVPMAPPIADEASRQAAFMRMREMFPTNRGLLPMYLLMANAHRYAIDYIEQAPVILLAAARGNAQVPL